MQPINANWSLNVVYYDQNVSVLVPWNVFPTTLLFERHNQRWLFFFFYIELEYTNFIAWQITVIQVIAPTTDYDDEYADDFYNKLQGIINKVDKKYILRVTGIPRWLEMH